MVGWGVVVAVCTGDAWMIIVPDRSAGFISMNIIFWNCEAYKLSRVFGQKGTEYPSVLHMICGLTYFLLWENLQVSHEIN